MIYDNKTVAKIQVFRFPSDNLMKMRAALALKAFRQFIDVSGDAMAMMPNAKGFFPEDHPSFVGIYWRPVSSPGAEAIVESADAARGAPNFCKPAKAGGAN